MSKHIAELPNKLPNELSNKFADISKCTRQDGRITTTSALSPYFAVAGQVLSQPAEEEAVIIKNTLRTPQLRKTCDFANLSSNTAFLRGQPYVIVGRAQKCSANQHQAQRLRRFITIDCIDKTIVDKFILVGIGMCSLVKVAFVFDSSPTIGYVLKVIYGIFDCETLGYVLLFIMPNLVIDIDATLVILNQGSLLKFIDNVVVGSLTGMTSKYKCI